MENILNNYISIKQLVKIVIDYININEFEVRIKDINLTSIFGDIFIFNVCYMKITRPSQSSQAERGGGEIIIYADDNRFSEDIYRHTYIPKDFEIIEFPTGKCNTIIITIDSRRFFDILENTRSHYYNRNLCFHNENDKYLQMFDDIRYEEMLINENEDIGKIMFLE